MLTYNPKNRLNVKQALAHPYFQESPRAQDPSLLPTYPEVRNQLAERERYVSMVYKRLYLILIVLLAVKDGLMKRNAKEGQQKTMQIQFIIREESKRSNLDKE